MAENPEGMWTKADRDHLAGLLDKINAVQIALRALCDRRKPVETPPAKTLAEAADILRTAATGLRDVLRHLDQMSTPSEPD